MEKKKLKAKKQFFWERYTEASDPNNIHYLSPLANSAFENRLQEFEYSFVSEKLKFDAVMRGRSMKQRLSTSKA